MLLIKNGYVMDPKSQIEGIRDVLIEDKKIVKIGKDLLTDMGTEEVAHLEIIDAEDVPLQYYPGNTARVKIKAAGDLA